MTELVIWYDDPTAKYNYLPKSKASVIEDFAWFEDVGVNTSDALYVSMLVFKANNKKTEGVEFFAEESECNYTNSIIAEHAKLISACDPIFQKELMDSIVQKMLITVGMFSEKQKVALSFVLLMYIRYIINHGTDVLRTDPYLFDDTLFEQEYEHISDYFAEHGNALSVVVSQINKTKHDEELLQWDDSTQLHLLDKIYEQKAEQLLYKDAIEEYYSILIAEYSLLLKKNVISGDVYLSGLYNKLYDVLYTKLALDVLAEDEDDFR